ncbi:MAG: alpha/beta fold hydrolase [Chthoniobacterales bacterium]
MPVLNSGGINLHYELDGHGPPLVLIAGYTCDLTQWALVRRELAAHHRLLLFDNRDSGRSENSAGPYSVAELAADAAGLMQSLGIGKAHVLGHSLGGAIAQTLAAEHPHLVDRLILSNTFLKFSAVTTAAFRRLLARRGEGHPAASLCEAALPWVYSNRFLSNPANIESTIAAMLANPQTFDGQSRQFDALVNFDSRCWFKNIAAPTLVIAGAEDICAPPTGAHELANGIPGARLAILPGMGHVPLLEMPSEFARLVLDHLA